MARSNGGYRPPAPTDRRERGVTFIELLVVITILGVMALTVIPNVGQWMNSYSLTREAQILRSNLQVARTAAIKDRKNTIFELVSATEYRLFRDDDKDGSFDTGEPLLVSRKLGSPVEVDTAKCRNGCQGGAATCLGDAGVRFGFSPSGTSRLDANALNTALHVRLKNTRSATADQYEIRAQVSGVVEAARVAPGDAALCP